MNDNFDKFLLDTAKNVISLQTNTNDLDRVKFNMFNNVSSPFYIEMVFADEMRKKQLTELYLQITEIFEQKAKELE